MKTTLDLPEEIVREVKLRAVLQRRTVKELVTELLRQGLKLEPASPALTPGSERVGIGEDGLPVIRCAPGAPATRMSQGERLALEQEALTEEDAKRAQSSFGATSRRAEFLTRTALWRRQLTR